MSETAQKPLTEDLLRQAADAVTDGHMTQETAHNLRNVLRSLAGLVEAQRSGEHTEPIGLLPVRSRELARSILDV